MGTTENIGLMTSVDADGNKQLLYPITKKEAVEGLTDALTDLQNKVIGELVPNTRTINGKALTEDITIGLSDVLGTEAGDGLIPVANGGTGAKDAATARANLGITPANIGAQPAGNYSLSTHNHDSIYAKLSHNHDSVYAKTNHTHTPASIGAAAANHTHSGYATTGHSHNTLKGSAYITVFDGDYDETVRIVDSFMFQWNGGNPYFCSEPIDSSLTFLGGGAPTEDFMFVGDVCIQGDIYGGPDIVSSDRRFKHDIYDISDKYEDFFNRLRPVSFIYNEKVRNHIGFVAQEVGDALEASGLTTREFAGYIAKPVFGKKYIDVERPVYNEEGEQTGVKTIKREVVDTDNLVDTEYMLRYDEFTALNTHMIQKLMKRVDELEKRLNEVGANG